MRKNWLVTLLVLCTMLAALEGPARAAMSDEEFVTLCAGNGTPEQIQAALDNGANVNGQDKNGTTPLLITFLAYKNSEQLKVLLRAGADVNAKSKKGYTPLMYAVNIPSYVTTQDQLVEAIRLLLDAGADSNAKNNYGETALMSLAKTEKKEVKELLDVLLRSGANINAQDDFGDTALIHATRERRITSVIAFLNAGADANIKNKKGERAIDFTKSLGWQPFFRSSAANAFESRTHFLGKMALELLQSKTK